MGKSSEFVSELRKTRQNSPIKEIIVENIMKDCIRIIKDTNNLGHTTFIYTVPPFMYGMPLYDVTYVSARIRKGLLKKGLEVVAIEHNKLSISW